MSKTQRMTDGVMASAGAGGFLGTVWTAMLRSMRIARARRALLSLDDRMLSDIGLTRSDALGDFWNVRVRHDDRLRRTTDVDEY